MEPAQTIGFVGFGEAGRAFARGFELPSGRAIVHDVKLSNGAAADIMQACVDLSVEPVTERDIGRARVVFSLVTADHAVAAARQSAPFLAPGTFWLDGNSCAPNAKRLASKIIGAVGGCYVDMAIMSPVLPKLHRTPVLLSGHHADAASDIVKSLGMSASVVGDAVGDASTIKMMRSIVVKGLEALTAEAFLAARRAGVEAKVIASLQASHPGMQWADVAAYNLERMLVHGKRRAAEMREVAVTLRDLGMSGHMASATALWQDELGALGHHDEAADLAALSDGILSQLNDR